MLSINKLSGLARLEFTSINKSLLGEVGISESGGGAGESSGGKGGGEKGRRKVERDLKESSCFLLSPAGLEGHNEHNELNELQNQLTN